MAWYNKKAIEKQKQAERSLMIKEKNLRLKEQSVNMLKKTTESMQAQMKGFQSFPSEFYTTGIKQGTNAGLMTSNNYTARRLSRATMNESPIAQAIVNTINTLTVGFGLELESQPIWDLLPVTWTDDNKAAWMKKVEARYKIWGKRKSVSYDEQLSRNEQEQQEFEDLLIDGEYFEVYRYSSNTRKNPMTIQLIRPEDVRTPTGSRVADNNFEENGIEYNAKGVAVAYHIYDYSSQKTVRVLKKGTRSGRVFVNHVKLGKNRRGTGIIASMITELMKLGDYEVLELQAAVVNAIYAVWMETPVGEDGIPTLTGGIGKTAQQTVTQGITVDDWKKDRENLDYSEGGLIVDALPGGYKMSSHDSKRPNVNFGTFSDQVIKNLAASRNLPVSVLQKQFQNSYSASRGELILAWYEIDKYRFNQSMTNDLVLKMWMWGEILNNEIDAPGFFDNEDIMDFWTNSKWIGNQRPDIDPLRSVKAHIEEHNRAYKTGKQITSERGGGDYDENLLRVKKELKIVAENIKPFADLGDSAEVDMVD